MITLTAHAVRDRAHRADQSSPLPTACYPLRVGPMGERGEKVGVHRTAQVHKPATWAGLAEPPGGTAGVTSPPLRGTL